ncbi:universal stress protein [Streptomyces sp. NPDC093984]|uniref:universal stress protein n=1 Tax=Streptomyces sp. NPDC093984 TaxID=3366052 RepID=UPI003824FD55
MRHRSVGDLMTPTAVSVRPDTTSKEIARLRDEYDITAVPVVDEWSTTVTASGSAAAARKEPKSSPNHPRAETREEVPTPTSHGGVVVALKLHGSCDDLLAFAFATAAVRKVGLRAVHGRSVPLHAQLPWGIDHDITEEIKQEAQEQLSQALRPRREKFPHVDVAVTIALDSPAKAVVRAAEGAGMLVVSRRRHHAALAPRLGPVAQAAIHPAHCPVAAVPHD